MKTIGILLVLSLGLTANAWSACPQTIHEVALDPTRTYRVVNVYDDNRLAVFVNGQLVINWSGPTPPGPGRMVNVSALFAPQRRNVVNIQGFNQAYQPGWHDPNPGDIEYHLDWVEGMRCVMSDWRVNREYQMFSSTYTFVDPRYADAVRPAHEPTKADPDNLTTTMPRRQFNPN
jgi:hypothetical protein